jgi:hypothetical protein
MVRVVYVVRAVHTSFVALIIHRVSKQHPKLHTSFIKRCLQRGERGLG